MPINRTASIPAVLAAGVALAVAILLAGCGGSSTTTQSAGVSSLTTTSSVAPASTTAASTSTSTSTTSSLAGTSTSRSANAGRSKRVKPATAGGTAPGSSAAKAPPGRLAIASAAFPRGGRIPARYTCDGGNVSPPLQWGKVPSGASELFVLALSLSAGAQGAIRWAVGGIDPSSGGFAAGQLPPGAVVGRSSDGHNGWTGICPAPGKPQSIIVLVYALRHPLNLAPGFDPRTAQRQLAGDTVGTGVVYGAYRRP